MSLLNLLPHLLNGITLGLLFALIALGFMLILGLMELINLAHGSLFALGAYVAYAITTPHLPLPPDLLQAWADVPLGWRFTVALLLAPVLVAPFGLVLERLMRRTYGRDPLYGLLLTFGVALVIEELIRVVWGTRDYMLPVPRGMSGGFIMLDLIWSTYRFCAAGLAVAAMALCGCSSSARAYGAMIKAGAHDSEMVRALGINLTRLGSGCSRSAPCWRRSPASSWRRSGASARTWASTRWCRRSSSSCWAGSGASGARCIGGLLVGMVVGLTGAYASEWSMLSMYLLLIAVVTFRARGLFGKKSVLEA